MMLTPKVQDRRPFLAVFASLVALCWLGLVIWDLSPYGVYLDHRVLGGTGFSLEYAGLATLFIAGWTLMTIAMMLPTVLPLLMMFRRLTASRRNADLLLGCLAAGYLALWVLAGATVHVGDLAIHSAMEHSHWLEERSWLLGVLVLFVAGAYQFTPLKYLCLEKCRSPYSFIVEHWHGRRERFDALLLGMHHGVFCIGCCWSLMLIMFAVGAGSVLWMLALGAVMAAEKNLPWGRRLSTPLGVFLLFASVALFTAQSTAGVACAHNGSAC